MCTVDFEAGMVQNEELKTQLDTARAQLDTAQAVLKAVQLSFDLEKAEVERQAVVISDLLDGQAEDIVEEEPHTGAHPPGNHHHHNGITEI